MNSAPASHNERKIANRNEKSSNDLPDDETLAASAQKTRTAKQRDDEGNARRRRGKNLYVLYQAYCVELTCFDDLEGFARAWIALSVRRTVKCHSGLITRTFDALYIAACLYAASILLCLMSLIGTNDVNCFWTVPFAAVEADAFTRGSHPISKPSTGLPA